MGCKFPIWVPMWRKSLSDGSPHEVTNPIPAPAYKFELTRQSSFKRRTIMQAPNINQLTSGSLWTSDQVAQFLGCTTRHVFNLRKRGLPAYRVGDMVRFDIQQILKWLDNGGEDARRRQLADVAASGDEDNAACATADLGKEFPLN